MTTYFADIEQGDKFRLAAPDTYAKLTYFDENGFEHDIDILTTDEITRGENTDQGTDATVFDSEESETTEGILTIDDWAEVERIEVSA